MYLKTDIKITNGEFPEPLSNEDICDFISRKYSHKLAHEIISNKPIQGINHQTREYKTEVMVILNPEKFIHAMRKLYDEQKSPDFFIKDMIQYIKGHGH